jgi:hypothetical protein
MDSKMTTAELREWVEMGEKAHPWQGEDARPYVAILAMLAFFVLPPLLQYGGQAATVADSPVAKWSGGELREKGLDRAVTMKLVLNRFLAEATMAAGRDPAQAPRYPADEQAVVRTMLLAEEATKNGIVVSDAAINDYLAKLTSGQVPADQFDQIMKGLRAGGAGVSQHDLFEALRHELLAQNMLILLQRGFSGDPPGLRWDYFRRLTQSATAEVVPVDVRSFGDQIKLPAGFKIDVWAADVPNARSMAISDNGIVFVGNRQEKNVYALVDENADGKADTKFILAEGLRMPNGVAYKNGDLYVAEVSRILRFKDIKNNLANPKFEVVYDGYPTDGHHGWKFIAFGPDGMLYVPVGAPCNICEKENPIYASITRLDVSKPGSKPEVYAHGVRNTVGFAWHPQSKECISIKNRGAE